METKMHIRVSRDIHKLNKVVMRMYNKKTKVSKRDIMSFLNIYDRLRAELDTDYLRGINDKQFDKLGYIYYVQKKN